jgi:hypothetical protein
MQAFRPRKQRAQSSFFSYSDLVLLQEIKEKKELESMPLHLCMQKCIQMKLAKYTEQLQREERVRVWKKLCSRRRQHKRDDQISPDQLVFTEIALPLKPHPETTVIAVTEEKSPQLLRQHTVELKQEAERLKKFGHRVTSLYERELRKFTEQKTRHTRC